MIKASIDLQDLRRKLYVKAKAEPSWRFWGLYVHVCKEETLREAYRMAKRNNGSAGVDGVTFDAIEQSGVGPFLEQLRSELVSHTYRPMRVRRCEIPKGNGKTRTLGIPTIRDRVVQGALKLILEPIFESDFQDGSFGYRPNRSAHDALSRVATGVAQWKTTVIDLDLAAYFDNVRHHVVLAKVAKRVDDDDVMHLLKLILNSTGKRGVPQGGVISPLLSNLYLNEVDKMLERAKDVTRNGRYTVIEYARYADDLAILIDGHPRNAWLVDAVVKRLREEFGKLDVSINEDKSGIINLRNPKAGFDFLGFRIKRVLSRRGRWRPLLIPQMKARKALLQKLKVVFRRFNSQPIYHVIERVNPIVRGWIGYFRYGSSSWCFGYVRDWLERKVRRHLMRARGRSGFGWKRWSRRWIYDALGLHSDWSLRRFNPPESRPSG